MKPVKLNTEQTTILRQCALRLLDTGLTSEEVARVTGLKKMQVAAFAAHRTMGRYGRDNVKFAVR